MGHYGWQTMKYKMTEVRPRIFFLEFTNGYDMAMLFLRYQEHYESPNVRFRNKSWTIVKFMEWYSKENGDGLFTYPADWAGFNIPAAIIKHVRDLGIQDHNHYDDEMCKIYRKGLDKYPDGKFYVIAAEGNKSVMRHEVAHGLFYTRPEYKKQMTKLVKGLDPLLLDYMHGVLKKLGYTTQVYVDECQAYLSTGFKDLMKFNGMTEASEPFIEVFSKFYKM